MNNVGSRSSRELLGCQIWLEQTDSKERVRHLFEMAAQSGLSWARLILMWPWIEEKPGQWNFRVFDEAFDAAEAFGIRIKATLTANSGPWPIGTPSVLHSHTGFLSPSQRAPMELYIQACVTRYREHAALGQWILWNEPTGGGDRTPETLEHWRGWLQTRYEGRIEVLNQCWRTGYESFGEVPFPEEVAHPVHKRTHWNSYGPWLDDWRSRSAWLVRELRWVQEQVRIWDPVTKTCVNPIPFLDNQAIGGIDLNAMGDIVDVVGASYHPAWAFTYADRPLFAALMAVGVRKQATNAQVRHVEVTEVQTGTAKPNVGPGSRGTGSNYRRQRRTACSRGAS